MTDVEVAVNCDEELSPANNGQVTVASSSSDTSNNDEAKNNNHISINSRRFLALAASNRPRSSESRLSQPRPSVWTLKDIQKVLPKQGPTSLFILKENNPVRRYARTIAESKYPFIISRSVVDTASFFTLGRLTFF
eukprot:gene16020-17638_t